MSITNFAGAIFTRQEVVMFVAAALLVAGTVIGLALYLGSRLRNRLVPGNTKKQVGLPIAVGFGLVAVLLLSLGIFVMPAMKSDSKWIKSQDDCALKAGFKDRFEAHSTTVDNLAEKQASYNSCLNTTD